MKNLNRKILVLCLVVLQIFVFSSCTDSFSSSKTSSIDSWDMSIIGYYQDWDKALSESGYTLGFIDMNTIVYSDNKVVTKRHIDLLTSTVKKLSNICEIEVIILNENSSIDEFYDAVLELIEKGVKVINVSLGRSDSFELNENIKNKINDEGILLICSAGNNSNQLLFPAMSNGTVSVLAIDIYGNTDKKLDNVNKKSFSAPGLHINLFDNYFSGSSISTVYVSVICAAYKAINPEYTNDEVIDILIESCIQGSNYSYGIPQIDKLF